jgi:hypothetical protein
MSVIDPTTSSDSPTIERTTSGEMREIQLGRDVLRRAVLVDRVPVVRLVARLRVAIRD